MRVAALCVVALVLSSCTGGQSDDAVTTAPPDATGEVSTTRAAQDAAADPSTTPAPPPRVPDCPEVVAVEMTETAPGVFTVNTTVRSVDIEGVSYADAWEVRNPDGEVYGERILTHPHANEQPFTRSLSGVAIPRDVVSVTVAARDSVRGFCGVPLTVDVPHS
jgi:hypothetical protein